MPTYSYACADCGPFEAIRPISERDLALGCRTCGLAAARVLAGAASVPRSDGSTRGLAAAQQRAAAEGAYSRMRHRGPCGCC